MVPNPCQPLKGLTESMSCVWPAYTGGLLWVYASCLMFIVWIWKCSAWAKCLAQILHTNKGGVCENWGVGRWGVLWTMNPCQQGILTVDSTTHGFFLCLVALASGISRFAGCLSWTFSLDRFWVCETPRMSEFILRLGHCVKCLPCSSCTVWSYALGP